MSKSQQAHGAAIVVQVYFHDIPSYVRAGEVLMQTLP
tara:strand:- start:20 stop:130 length:111 start_codon:yes stop_codon:yes gene_type:complete